MTDTAMPDAGWTDARIDDLKLLFASGEFSSAQIAAKLGGGLTRSAVTCKARRLRLVEPSEASPYARSNPLVGTLGSAVPKAPSVPRNVKIANGRNMRSPLIVAGCGAVIEKPPGQPPLETIPERNEPPGCATLLTLGGRMCKWPIGDPSQDDFTFCGLQADGGPYCGEHHSIAYAPPKPGQARTGNELARALRRYI